MRAKKGTSLLDRKASEVKRYRQEKKIVPIVMACIALLTGIVYVISLLYTRFGSFTVSVNKFHNLDYGIALCETRDFAKPTARLNCKASKEITNIDGKVLDDIEEIGTVDGEHNGNNYMCYTFYCRNTGNEELDYEFSVNIVNMTLEIESAVRIRVITKLNENPEVQKDYAQAKGKDEAGNVLPETAPYECINFYTEKIAVQESVGSFKPGDTMRYTIVLWLEGNDKDCVDDIIGGTFKIDMKFVVTSVSGEDVNN